MIGYNYRMTNIQAAIGLAQMETIEPRLLTVRRWLGWYDEALAPLEGQIVLPSKQTCASMSSGCTPSS